MSTDAAFTSFGDDQNTAVKFSIWMPNGVAPDWEGGDRILNYLDVGNGQQIVQRGGWNPWFMTCTVELENIDALGLLASLQGEAATLRLMWGTTKRAGGTKQTILDTDYLILPDTLLINVTSYESDGVIDGPRDATVTFRRSYVPSPYVGFTTVGADS